MLKSVLYYLLILFTGVRFIDIIYLLSTKPTNLPIPVIAVTSAMVLYGTVLIVKRFVSNLRMKELMAFYLVQAAAIVFNLAFVSRVCPLTLSFSEILCVGTFFDLIVAVSLVYYCVKQLRRPVSDIAHMAPKGQLHV